MGHGPWTIIRGFFEGLEYHISKTMERYIDLLSGNCKAFDLHLRLGQK
jgi:hypothetical protein